jgi:hypothetical protein
VSDDEHADVQLALMLLRGHLLRAEGLETIASKNDLPKLVFLSSKTRPTEDDARRALCRMVRNSDQEPPRMILEELARVFDPDLPGRGPRLKAILKRRDRGHLDPWRDAAIAYAVFKLRVQEDKTYEDAIQQVAKTIGKSPEHVKRIYGKSHMKHRLSRPARRPP